MKNYTKLQNGSDIRGVALPIPGGPEVNLTEEVASDLAGGFARLLKKETSKDFKDLKIAVGRDPRITGPTLEDAISTALASFGVFVYSSGLSSTPAMFMTTVFPEYDCDGAIMITASHMPYERNGMKFFTKKGGLEKSDISELIGYAEEPGVFEGLTPAASENDEPSKEEHSGARGSIQKIDLIERYSEHLRDIIRKELAGGDAPEQAGGDAPLTGLRITVDAGNGGGGFYAEKVLAPLGADVSTSQFLEPDGNFPNHIPNPENKEAMESICNRVLETGTDLGLIFDTDVDRASAVDETGKEIAHNGIVAMAAALIAEDYPGTTVVTDSVTSTELHKFITETLGLKHLRYKRGYRNVIGKAIELNQEGIDSQLAIETSGHGAYKQNYFLDDGAYLATLIVIKAAKLMKEGKRISSVLEDLEEPLEARELRLPLSADDFSQVGDRIIEKLTDVVKSGLWDGAYLEEPNYEGVRINFTGEDIRGWLLLRKSLHDPIMPLNMEAMAEGGCERISKLIYPVLSEFSELDAEALAPGHA